MTPDLRERGPWKRTPYLLRLLGWPAYRRSTFADWRIGGGWDGFEYASVLEQASLAYAAKAKKEQAA